MARAVGLRQAEVRLEVAGLAETQLAQARPAVALRDGALRESRSAHAQQAAASHALAPHTHLKRLQLLQLLLPLRLLNPQPPARQALGQRLAQARLPAQAL